MPEPPTDLEREDDRSDDAGPAFKTPATRHNQ